MLYIPRLANLFQGRSRGGGGGGWQGVFRMYCLVVDSLGKTDCVWSPNAVIKIIIMKIKNSIFL